MRDVEGDEVVATFVDPDIPLRFRQGEVERVFDTSGARLSASTNGAAVDNVFNPDRELYWQSDGERGTHWVQIELPQVPHLTSLPHVVLRVTRYFCSPRHFLNHEMTSSFFLLRLKA